MYRWLCFALAVAFVCGVGWVIHQLRRDIEQATHTINENLPEILANTRKSSETLAVVSEDIRNLRDLAGAAEGSRDRSLVVFADLLLDEVESSGGIVGVQKKVFGEGLKDTLPAEEWAVSARKEALWLSLRVKSRDELFQRLTENKFGSKWHLQMDEEDTIAMDEWLVSRLPEITAPDN